MDCKRQGSSSSKLIVVKALPTKLIDICETLKTDIEASNRGILALSGSGLLVVVVWIKKKILIKHIEDVSDALWQQGGRSEMVAAGHSGALFRYTLDQDTGLSKSLQLSVKSLLSMINSKDSTIASMKSIRIWGHTCEFILLQPQPDRLVLLSTNSDHKPDIIGILKTASVRSAHLTQQKIIVQPFTGSDIYIYDTVNCKTIEVISLVVSRPGVPYIQWDYLNCSLSGCKIAITDSERRLYIAKLTEKANLGKKSGVNKSHVILNQVVWPSNFKLSCLNDICLNLSDNLLSVFCSDSTDQKAVHHYLTYNVTEGGSLIEHHTFHQSTLILPGILHGLPDLFLTEDGICMLTDRECPVAGPTLHFEQILESLNKALEEVDMDKIFEIKLSVEEDLSLFLASCNHKENWLDLAKVRSEQHAQLVDVILSYLTKSSSAHHNRTTLLGLKELAQHHFRTLRDEMQNVLKYVDIEAMSQMLLQMIEQMNFYSKSIESLQLPEGKMEDRIILEKFEVWCDRPIRDILEDALVTKCVKIAEHYLSLKPWIYGQIDSQIVGSTCIDIARESYPTNILLNMDRSYETEFKRRFYASQELNEICLLEGVLSEWESVSPKEKQAYILLSYIHRFSPHMISRPPKLWSKLVIFRNESVDMTEDLMIGNVMMWSSRALNFVLIDLFARTNDPKILEYVDMTLLWTYLLIREDEDQLLKWISHQFRSLEMDPRVKDVTTSVLEEHPEISLLETTEMADSCHQSINRVTTLKGRVFVRKREKRARNFFSIQNYQSDTESVYSTDSSIWEGPDESIPLTTETSFESINHYTVTEWNTSYFGFISQEMVDDVMFSTTLLAQNILNTLALFGIFPSSEKADPQLIFRRLRHFAAEGWQIHLIPVSPEYTHKLDIMSLHTLVLEKLYELDLYAPFFEYVSCNKVNLKQLTLSQSQKRHWVDLVLPFQELKKNQTKETIYQLCLDILTYNFKKSHKIMDYFAIFLTMLYAPNASLSNFLNYSGPMETSLLKPSEDDSKGKDVAAICQILSYENMTPRQVIEKLADGDYPFLQPILKKALTRDQLDVSIYDLLRGSVPFDISRLFTWQKGNRYGYNKDSIQPSFLDESLCKKDGIECKLDYYYYLKAGRPSFALASILLNVEPERCLQKLKEIECPVYGLALTSWPHRRICSACVSLLHLAGVEYEQLRTILYSADLIVNVLESEASASTMHPNLKKSHVNLLRQEIKELFHKICTSHTRVEASSSLISLLEYSLLSKVTKRTFEIASYSVDRNRAFSLSEDLKSKEQIYIIMLGLKLTTEIAKMYRLPHPQGILAFLATNDQWLIFLTMVDLFQYPPAVASALSQKFKSISLREHMKLATQHVRPFSKADNTLKVCEVGEISSSKYEKRRRRRKQAKIPKADSSRTTEEGGAVEASKSKDAQGSEESAKVVESPSGNIFVDCTDFFSVLIKCHSMKDPTLSLLEVCLTSKCPVLAVIAACYDPSRKFGCLTAWLIVQIPQNIQVQLKEESIVFVEGTKREFAIKVPDILDYEEKDSLLGRLLTLFLEFECIDTLQKGFRIFEQTCPMLPLLEGLREAKMGRNTDAIINTLSECCENIESFRSDYFVSDLCIHILCQGLKVYLKNRALQKCFLTAIISFAKERPFSWRNTDWKMVKELLSLLGMVPMPENIFDAIDFSDKFDWKSYTSKLVQHLAEIKEYEIALSICELVDLDTGYIFCLKIKSKFDELNKEIIDESAIIKFLSETNEKVKAELIASKTITKMFETMGLNAASPLVTFLCLQYAVVWAHICKEEMGAAYIQDAIELAEDDVAVQWLTYLENVEFVMWLSWLQWVIDGKDQMKDTYMIPPPELGEWPWEVGMSSGVLDYLRLRDASSVEYKLLRRAEFWNPQNYIDKLKDKFGVTKEDIERVLLNIVSGYWRRELVVTACRIANHFDFLQDVSGFIWLFDLVNNLVPIFMEDCFQDLNSFLNIMKRTCDCDFSDRRFHSEFESEPRSPSIRMKFFPGDKRSSFSSISLTTLPIEGEEHRWLSSILNLAADVTDCNQTLKRVLTLCRVADATSVSYSTYIQCSEITELLVDILSAEGTLGIRIVKDLITALPLSKELIIKMLCDEAVSFVSFISKAKTVDSKRHHFLTYHTMDEKWPEVITLLDDSSVVGYQLMDTVLSLTKNPHPDHVAKVQFMSVELIIRAHDCFSQAADMEGINLILQTAPNITKSLLQHKQWSLMSRLLTGVRRYKEMAYIMDVLREHQQFELLLGKNALKKMDSSGLDKALVHYLRSKHPQDKDTLRMVALHFLMYSELAKMWAKEADEILKKIIEKYLYVKKPPPTPGAELETRASFFSVLSSPSQSQHLLHASQSGLSSPSPSVIIDYLKSADCGLLSEAMRCYHYASQYCIQERQLVSGVRHSRKAELVALQLSFVKDAAVNSSGLALRIINLLPASLNQVLNEHLSVPEIIVVSRAYDVSPDWAGVLYQHFIRNGFKHYLDDFLRFNHLSSDVVLNIVTKMEKMGMEPQHKERMSVLLSHIQEMDFVYKISSQLNIRNKMEWCLEAPFAPYLKDTVFRKGMKASLDI